MSIYAITGITGHTGSVVAETLRSAGHQVRAVSRAVADFGDTDALTRAFEGVDGVYLLVPPKLDAADPIAHNRGVIASLARAVAAARVPHVVLLSSIGAQHATGTGPIRSVHIAEAELAATGAALTAVRAAYFMENWAASLGFVGQGFVPTFLPANDEIPMVATADIGRTAAQALVEGGRGRQVIELAGPRDVSPADVATAVGAILGRPIRAEEAALDAVVPTFTNFGMSTAVAELFRELYAGIASGRVAWEGGAARTRRGRDDIDEVLRGLLGRGTPAH